MSKEGMFCPFCFQSRDTKKDLACHLHLTHDKIEIIKAFINTMYAKE